MRHVCAMYAPVQSKRTFRFCGFCKNGSYEIHLRVPFWPPFSLNILTMCQQIAQTKHSLSGRHRCDTNKSGRHRCACVFVSHACKPHENNLASRRRNELSLMLHLAALESHTCSMRTPRSQSIRRRLRPGFATRPIEPPLSQESNAAACGHKGIQ